MENIRVLVNGEPATCEAGTTLYQLSVQYAEKTIAGRRLWQR